MFQVLLLVFLHSLLIRDIIQTSLFILNAILLPSKPVTLPQTSISYRVPSKLKSLWSNSIIRNLLIYDIPPLLISKQVIKSLSRLSSLKPLSLQKSFLKNISDSTKSFLSLVHYHSLSIFQSLCALSIQFSMYPCSNLPYPTQLASILVIIDGKPKYKISQIVNSKINHQQACKLQGDLAKV